MPAVGYEVELDRSGATVADQYAERRQRLRFESIGK